MQHSVLLSAAAAAAASAWPADIGSRSKPYASIFCSWRLLALVQQLSRPGGPQCKRSLAGLVCTWRAFAQCGLPASMV